MEPTSVNFLAGALGPERGSATGFFHLEPPSSLCVTNLSHFQFHLDSALSVKPLCSHQFRDRESTGAVGPEDLDSGREGLLEEGPSKLRRSLQA